MLAGEANVASLPQTSPAWARHPWTVLLGFQTVFIWPCQLKDIFYYIPMLTRDFEISSSCFRTVAVERLLPCRGALPEELLGLGIPVTTWYRNLLSP